MKKILFIIFLFASMTNVCKSQLYTVDTFNMTNTPALTSNFLTTVAVGKHGVIWAGSLNQGLYRFKYYDDGSFVKAPMLTNHAIRSITSDHTGRLYIGQYGSSGSQAINGGIDRIADSTFIYTHFGALDAQPNNLKTRYVRSVYLNPLNNNLYVSNSDDITAGNPRIGGMSIIKQASNPGYTVTKFAASNWYNIDGAQMNAITGVSLNNSNEIWLAANRNCLTGGSCFSPRILRFDLNGNYLNSYFDNTNSNNVLPLFNIASSATVRAMTQDAYNNVWVGMSDGTIAVYNPSTNLWTEAFIDLIVPSGSSVNFNAIHSDYNKVYIGTVNGLLIYKGGDINSTFSYKFLTTSDGLCSNNITGITKYGFYDLWCSSSLGLMRIKEKNKFLSSYQVPYDNPTASGDFMYINSLSIAADSSRNVRFEAFDPFTNMSSKKIRILEDTNSLQPLKYGKLDSISNNGITIKYMFRSPAYFDQSIATDQHFIIHIQVYDKITNIVDEEKEIRIIRPPVVMLHGLWSDNSIWVNLKQKLTNSGAYSPNQLYAFSYPGGDAFKSNFSFVKNSISSFKNNLREFENISCGKIDIIGHSMGGILARLYLQSQYYKNDLNKLISLNTPHSGSPFGNLLTKMANSASVPIDNASKTLFGELGLNITNTIRVSWTVYNPANDAIRDLAIGSDQMINNLNNPANLINGSKAAIHGVFTTADPLDPLINWVAGGTPKRGLYSSLVRFMYHSAKKRTPATTLSNFAFNGGANDLIVSDSSQKGGLNNSNLSFISNQDHAGSTNNIHVIDTLYSLLKLSPLNSRFTHNGFAPLTITSPFRPVGTNKEILKGNDTKQKTRTISTIDITNITSGSNYFSGDTLTINVTGSADIQNIGILFGGKSAEGISQILNTGNVSTFTLQIPIEADGIFPIVAVGFNDSGLVALDTLSININQNALLENIFVPNTVYTLVNDSSEVLLFGTFSDGITRNISYNDSISISTNPSKCIHTSKNIIKGIAISLDTITINYAGKTTTAKVEIIENLNAPLPIILNELTAKCNLNMINLMWSTNSEKNDVNFILQRSNNGKEFKNIASLLSLGGNNENTDYVYIDSLPISGLNYYRLLFHDIDGNHSYSPTISINKCSEFEYGIHPNPAKNSFTVFTKNKQASYSVSVMDITGKIVLTSKKTMTEDATFDINQLKIGTYVINIITATGTQSFKLLKE